MLALYIMLPTLGIASSASLTYQENSDRTKVYNLDFWFFHVKKKKHTSAFLTDKEKREKANDRRILDSC